MEENSGSGSFYFNSTSDTANDTLTCAARNIQGPLELPFDPLLPLVARCVLIIYFMIIAFFGTVFNCFVLYLVCRYKVLQTLSFVFVLQVIFVDIIGSAFIVPVSFFSLLANQWLLGEYTCIIVGAIRGCISLLRTGFLAGLVTDRFCCVYFAFSYPRHRLKTLWCMSIVAYLGTAVINLFPIIFDCFTFSNASWICRVSSTCSPQCAVIKLIRALGIFLPLRVFPVILYSAMYCKGRKAKRSMREAAASISASEALKLKRDNRATITFFLMFLSLFLVAVPPGLVSFSANVIGIFSDSSESVWLFIIDTLTINFVYLGYVADPFFILRNKDVREVLSEIEWFPCY